MQSTGTGVGWLTVTNQSRDWYFTCQRRHMVNVSNQVSCLMSLANPWFVYFYHLWVVSLYLCCEEAGDLSPQWSVVHVLRMLAFFVMFILLHGTDVHKIFRSRAIFTPQPLRAPGYCRTPSGRAAGQTSPVNTLTSIIFHGSFSNLARTFIALRSRTSSIMEVLPH